MNNLRPGAREESLRLTVEKTVSTKARREYCRRGNARRMTRLTNAFSKKWGNLKAAYALWFAFYNFCRVYRSIRMTPAMEAGIENRIWTLRDLLS